MYRAVDQYGQVIDVLVSGRRNAGAARRFFGRALSTLRVTPSEVITDAAAVYPGVLDELIPQAWHHVEQYANNPIEADHSQLTHRLRPMRGQSVAQLKNPPGKDILMFGSRTLWNDLLVAGLVDELHLMVGAAVLGGGTPAFGAGPVSPLRLLGTRRRDGSHNVLHYQVVSRDE